MPSYDIMIDFEYESDATVERLEQDIRQIVESWPGASGIDVTITRIED